MDQRALPDLLACPCCGGRAVMIWPYADDDDEGEAHVECSDCGLRSRLVMTAQQAKEEWNLRTPVAPRRPE
jgi:transcription elongation factor Elf1